MMRATTVQRVKPDNGVREGMWVGSAIAGLLLFAVTALPFHQAQSHDHGLAQHQVSDRDIDSDNHALFAELRIAFEEIRDLYQDNGQQWPEITELQDEFLPPFVEDMSWQRQGAHRWQHLGDGEYLGQPGQDSAPAVLLLAAQQPAQIWFHPAPVAGATDTNIDQLIHQGWKQLVNAQATPGHHH